MAGGDGDTNDAQTEWETVGYLRLSESGKAVVLTDGKGNRTGVIKLGYLQAVILGESEYCTIRLPMED